MFENLTNIFLQYLTKSKPVWLNKGNNCVHEKEEGTKLSVYYSKWVSKKICPHIEGLRSTYSTDR